MCTYGYIHTLTTCLFVHPFIKHVVCGLNCTSESETKKETQNFTQRTWDEKRDLYPSFHLRCIDPFLYSRLKRENQMDTVTISGDGTRAGTGVGKLTGDLRVLSVNAIVSRSHW